MAYWSAWSDLVNTLRRTSESVYHRKSSFINGACLLPSPLLLNHRPDFCGIVDWPASSKVGQSLVEVPRLCEELSMSGTVELFRHSFVKYLPTTCVVKLLKALEPLFGYYTKVSRTWTDQATRRQ